MTIAAHAPPVFLDRDGTLIVEKHYLSDPDQVELEAGVVEGLRLLRHSGHPLFVVSNQSGIGRGKFSAADARQVNEKTDAMLRLNGIEISAWYMCPHEPDSACACRKPLPGMLLAASEEWGVRLQGSYVVGDKRSDLELADAVGGTGILVTSGHGAAAAAWAHGAARPVFARFDDAANFIIAAHS